MKQPSFYARDHLAMGYLINLLNYGFFRLPHFTLSLNSKGNFDLKQDEEDWMEKRQKLDCGKTTNEKDL
jgi:hypothetical protein